MKHANSTLFRQRFVMLVLCGLSLATFSSTTQGQNGMGSPHPSVMPVSFADGHVSNLRYSWMIQPGQGGPLKNGAVIFNLLNKNQTINFEN